MRPEENQTENFFFHYLSNKIIKLYYEIEYESVSKQIRVREL